MHPLRIGLVLVPAGNVMGGLGGQSGEGKRVKLDKNVIRYVTGPSSILFVTVTTGLPRRIDHKLGIRKVRFRKALSNFVFFFK